MFSSCSERLVCKGTKKAGKGKIIRRGKSVKSAALRLKRRLEGWKTRPRFWRQRTNAPIVLYNCSICYLDLQGSFRFDSFARIMKIVKVKKVRNRREMNDFIRFPEKLYSGFPYYVPDMESDIRDTFNPQKNAGLEFSDIQAFVAYDGEGNTVGRIVGIVNRRANEKWGTRNVRFGFIEFVDDADVSAALLNAVEAWGRERGMDCIQGPMGIFDFDKEGMLVEDFDQAGSLITIYNYPYYPRHLEALGYEKEVDWVQVRINVPEAVPPKYERVARLSKELFGLRVRKLTGKDIAAGYGHKVFRLLNEAYSPLFGYTELSERQIDLYVRRYIPLINLEMVPVVENEKGEMVGVAVTMGSLSEALRKSKGRLFPFGWYPLLRALKWKHEEKAELLLVAVRPDY